MLYAHRIKSLALILGLIRERDARLLEHMLTSGMLCLPNLVSVDIHLCETSRAASNLWRLLNPRFVSLAISFETVPEEDIDSEEVMSSLLDALPVATPVLRKLEIQDLPEQVASASLSDSLKRAAHGLKDTLTHLTTGNVSVNALELLQLLSDTKTIVLLSITLQASSTASRRIHGRVKTNVRTISLKVESLLVASEFVNEIQCPQLRDLRIVCSTNLQTCIQGLGETLVDSGCTSLHSVVIKWGRYHAVENHESPEVLLPKTSLAPFLRLSGMWKFIITASLGNLVYDIDSTFLRQIIQSWPKLTTLGLQRGTAWDTWAPTITLPEIVDFIVLLPYLRALNIDIDFDCNTSHLVNHALPFSRQSPTRHLDLGVGFAVVTSPKHIAGILSETGVDFMILPSWGQMRFDDDIAEEEWRPKEKAWDDVESDIRVMTRVRMLERDRIFAMLKAFHEEEEAKKPEAVAATS